jgi:hypothetical protein
MKPMLMRISAKPVGFAIGTLLLLVAAGADGPKQTIRGAGLKCEAPAAWKSGRPSNSMRLAELAIAPVDPDKDIAEFTVYSFPGGAGSVQDNIKRWQTQFEDEAGKAPNVVREKRKGKNVDVIYAEVAGRYVAAVRPGAAEHFNKPGYRLLGAIVETPKGAYFLKLVGPDKTVKAAKPDFDDLIASITIEDQ